MDLTVPRAGKPRLLSALLAAAASVVVPLASVGAAPSSARVTAAPRSPVLLTYNAIDGGLCVVRADGTHAVRLTARSTRVEDPAWSPNGRYVAFDRSAGYGSYDSDPLAKVVIADARGRVHWAFGTGSTNLSGLWSPDGRQFLYFADEEHGYSFDVARADGSGDHMVAGEYGYQVSPDPLHPAWTRDGQRVVFDDLADPATGRARSIFSVAAADGGDRRLVVANAAEPAYSPDGSKLAYVRWDSQGPEGVVVAQTDGSDPQLISSSIPAPPYTDIRPVLFWSPDGKAVAFEHERSIGKVEIVVARADGSGERVVAARGGDFVGWSPDGKLIAFHLDDRLFVVSPRGGRPRLLVRTGPSSGAAWRRAVPLPPAKRLACPDR